MYLKLGKGEKWIQILEMFNGKSDKVTRLERAEKLGGKIN